MNTKHRSNLNLSTGIAAIFGLAISCANLSGADTHSTPLGEGKLSIDARIRYEYIDGKNGADNVNAFGERTRLGYTLTNDSGVSAMVEVEDVHFIDSKDRPGLDVPTTELNQAWVNLQGAKIGRQIYTLDDHRFIGHVGWRQNIQTFDALTSSLEIDSQSKLNLGYLHSVKRINDTSQDLDGIILNGNRK
ncbi:MAG: alginate export family protein, partial [Opitutales bacterium]|nr:alginate export family protein [Opitutales bacterium]